MIFFFFLNANTVKDKSIFYNDLIQKKYKFTHHHKNGLIIYAFGILLNNEYALLTAEQDFLVWQSVHFQTIKSLKSRNDVYITKPDKGSGIVILNRQDYLDKMASILNDSSMFKIIDPASTCDNTSQAY